MAVGWIKLHRKIMECSLWDDDEPSDRKSAWIDLLLMANHRDKQIIFKGKPMTIKAGQRLTSIRKLATMWNWSINRVKRYLDLLESLNMITVQSDSNGTLLTIVKYEVYQGDGYTDEYTHGYSDGYSDDTPTDTVTDTVTDTKQEDNKNEKNEKKKYGEYAHVRLTDSELQKLQAEYGEQMINDCITYLDEYIEMKGYKAKSHYLCIKRWVVDAVKEKKPSKKPLVDSSYDESMEMLKKMLEG
ncbi:MAG: hypothetical protein J6U74_00035 [Clostridia bacterium]|nr:hypothetical protein [Clostridia bacterium]